MTTRILFLLFTGFIYSHFSYGQTFVFAELSGSPNINTAGWNLTGNAYAGDTPGDADVNPDELILTNAANSQSGGVFWAEPIDPSTCTKWIVEFDYRIWGGSAADGIAFCFLDVPPAGFVSGGGVGIPGTANGLKIILDTWNNCGGPNPELQIFNGVGYNECAAGIFKIDNSAGTLGFVRSPNYQPVRITYDSGTIELYINNTLYLSAFSPVTFSGYMGFTASTGGANDQHSVKNVIIYTEQAESNAGSDVSTCSNSPIQIGTVNNPEYEYSWSPSTGLNDATISNPTVTLVNATGSSVTQTYTVTTTLASNPGVCPTTDEIDVTVFSTFDETITVSQCGGNFSFNGTVYNQSGVYTANLLSSSGCDSNVTLNLTIWDNPVILVNNETICFGESTDLVANGGTTYSWSPANAGDGINGTLTVSPATTTIYTVIGTDANGCTNSNSATVTVNPQPQISASASEIEICYGESTELSATGGIIYEWQGNGITAPSSSTQIVTPVSSETYILIGTDGNGCSNTDEVSVTVNSLPIMNINATSSEICIGENSLLTANGAASYYWNGPNIFDPAANPQDISPISTSNYNVVGTSPEGCQDSVQITIIVNPLPILTITNPQDICDGDSAIIFVEGAAAYEWVPFIPNQDDMQIAVVSPASSMDYLVTGTDLNGCISSISTSVNVLPLPEANFFMSPTDLDVFENTNTTMYNNSSYATNYWWDFGDGSGISIEENPSHTFETESASSYIVTLYAENNLGCIDSTSRMVSIGNGLVYYIPNTFTPDGDMVNQTFQPVFSSGFDEYDFIMQIYNRWGELIFETQDADIGWDGTYGGRLAPDGTYTYVIKYKIPNNDVHGFIRGHVNLIR